MALPVLPIEPYNTLRVNRTPRVRRIQFGDGYQQRVADGIHNNPQRWSVSYERQRGVDIETLEAFFTGLGGVDAFQWTPPGESSPRAFVCASTDRDFDEYNAVQTLTCTFDESFEGLL